MSLACFDWSMWPTGFDLSWLLLSHLLHFSPLWTKSVWKDSVWSSTARSATWGKAWNHSLIPSPTPWPPPARSVGHNEPIVRPNYAVTHGLAITPIHPKYPFKPSTSSLVSKSAPKRMKGTKATPHAKWSVVKRTNQPRGRIYVARLVFHRTLH